MLTKTWLLLEWVRKSMKRILLMTPLRAQCIHLTSPGEQNDLLLSFPISFTNIFVPFMYKRHINVILFLFSPFQSMLYVRLAHTLLDQNRQARLNPVNHIKETHKHRKFLFVKMCVAKT